MFFSRAHALISWTLSIFFKKKNSKKKFHFWKIDFFHISFQCIYLAPVDVVEIRSGWWMTSNENGSFFLIFKNRLNFYRLQFFMRTLFFCLQITHFFPQVDDSRYFWEISYREMGPFVVAIQCERIYSGIFPSRTTTLSGHCRADKWSAFNIRIGVWCVRWSECNSMQIWAILRIKLNTNSGWYCGAKTTRDTLERPTQRFLSLFLRSIIIFKLVVILKKHFFPGQNEDECIQMLLTVKTRRQESKAWNSKSIYLKCT